MSFESVYNLLDELAKLDFSDFDVYYTECNHEPALISEKSSTGVLVEALIAPKTLMNNTEAKRATRGKDDVEILDYKISKADPKKYGQGYKILEYAAVSDPTSEHKVHHGYIVYFQPNGKVKSVFCDCRDFFYKLYAPYVKAGLATFNLDKKYKDYLAAQHNKKWTNKTNPDGKLYLCKHLYKVMDEIMDSDNFVKKLLDTDAEDERIKRDINGDEFGRNKEIPEPVTSKKKPTKKPVSIVEPEIEEIPEEEPEEIEEPITEIPPEEEEIEEIPPEEEPIEELPPPIEEPEEEEETEFDKDLQDIVPGKNIKVNYPKEKKPAAPAKIGTGFIPKPSKDTV